MKIYLIEKKLDFYSEIIAAKHSKEDAQAFVNAPRQAYIPPTKEEWLEKVEAGFFHNFPLSYQAWCKGCEYMWEEANNYSFHIIEVELS